MERKEARDQINSINNELQFVNKRLKDLAIKDTLTGLYNRQGFNEELEIQMGRAKKANRSMEVSFLYADLDNFKYYNDTFGHDIGDSQREVSVLFYWYFHCGIGCGGNDQGKN